MAEPEYPNVWGVWVPNVWWSFDTDETCIENEAIDHNGTVVELIPRPTHERLVAEAIAGERERCVAIIDKAYCANTDEAMRWSNVAKRIREVPS